MWSALLRLAELLIKALTKDDTPEGKRRLLAKDLAKIYMDIDEIVDRGNELLSLFSSGALIVNDAEIAMLLAQQTALHSVRNHIQHVAPILDIHFPEQASNLSLLIENKWEKIMFLLRLVSSMTHLSRP